MCNKTEGRFFSSLFAKLGGKGWGGRGLLVAAALLFAAPVFAQFGAPPGQSQGTQAVQLPLSGRTSQTSGTVKTSEAPAPSTTATVNTLSPNVQVQGVYAGSTPGVSKMPFSGMLGLREAIQRGLAYNLGQTGATQALRQAQGQSKVALSSLLPNINGTINENVQTTDLRAEGFRFSFPGLDGKIVSNTDPQFKGKVVILAIGGSWCPNCQDEAPFLVDLYKEFHSQGLEIVGLMFEADADPALARPRVQTFIRRFGIPYSMLLAGTPDDIDKKIPQLVNFGAYPTSIFLGRDGRVRSVHAGFASQATGQEYVRLKGEVRSLVQRLLAENSQTSRAASGGL